MESGNKTLPDTLNSLGLLVIWDLEQIQGFWLLETGLLDHLETGILLQPENWDFDNLG